jgi:hypothetical protein
MIALKVTILNFCIAVRGPWHARRVVVVGSVIRYICRQWERAQLDERGELNRERSVSGGRGAAQAFKEEIEVTADNIEGEARTYADMHSKYDALRGLIAVKDQMIWCVRRPPHPHSMR